MQDGSCSDPFLIKSGVKQGCVLAPTLSGIFFSLLLSHAFKSSSDGVYLHTRSDGKLFSIARLRAKTKVTEILIREILYAGDAALASHTEDSLTASPKPARISASQSASKRRMCIKIDDHTLEVVDEFVYLGSTISTNMNLDTEINKRIEKTAATLSKLTKRVWNNTYSRRTPRCVCTRHASSACFSTAARLGPHTCARNTDSTPFTCAV